jgi:hypothetical protein
METQQMVKSIHQISTIGMIVIVIGVIAIGYTLLMSI